MIKGLMRYDPAKRWTLDQCKDSPFVKELISGIKNAQHLDFYSRLTKGMKDALAEKIGKRRNGKETPEEGELSPE